MQYHKNQSALPIIGKKRGIEEIELNFKARVQGRVRVEIVNAADGSVAEDKGWQSNLILDKGLDLICNVSSTQAICDKIVHCHAGTGTTPVKRTPDGTYEQTGTTVTRSSGTGTLDTDDVGNRIRFGTGQHLKIVSRTNSTTVVVDRSQTVAPTSLEIFRTKDLGLATFVKGTSTLSSDTGANASFADTGTGEVTHQRTYVFSAESSPVNYTEIGIANQIGTTTGGTGNMFARIVLDSPASVGTGQQLRVTYQVTLVDNGPITPTERTLSITGWPYEYLINGIVSTGSNFTVTLNKAHHYVAGGKINIAGALPVKKAITGITSTVSDFTVTAPAHGLSPSDSIEIEDCTVTDYNGTWTVDSAPDGDTLIVLSASNPGAASDGTVRITTPSPWYDGEWTIASVSGSDVTITSAINPIAAGDSGTVVNNLKADVMHAFWGYKRIGEATGGSNFEAARLYEGIFARAHLIRVADVLTPSTFPWELTTVSQGVQTASATITTYVNGSGIRINTVTWALDASNFSDLKQIALVFTGNSPNFRNLCALINFHERQRKDSGYALSLTITRAIEQVLA